MATNKNEKMDAIIVTLNTYLKAIQSRLISNYGEFAIIRNQAGLYIFSQISIYSNVFLLRNQSDYTHFSINTKVMKPRRRA